MMEFILTNWFWFLLPVIFYSNHLWIFGLSKLFHVELFDTDYPEHGDIRKSRGLLGGVTMFYYEVFGDRRINKALFECPPCMASIHSTYYFWIPAFIFGFHWIMIPLYFNYVVCLSGLNYLKNE